MMYLPATSVGTVHWATAEAYAGDVIAKLLRMDWKPGQFVNVNFPDCPPEEVQGIRVTTQGMRPPGAFQPIRRVDERYVPYYWIKIQYKTGAEGASGPGTDLQAITDGEIAVTPVQLDWTAQAFKDRLKGAFGDLSL